MKKNTYIICLSLALSLLMVNCKDATPPIIQLNGTDALVDTMKLFTGGDYEIEFNVLGEGDNHTLLVGNNNNCIVIYQNEVINGDEVNISSSGRFLFRPNRTGDIDLDFVMKKRKNFSVSTLDMFVLDNLPPVAALTAEQTNLNAPFEVRMDASDSYDLDGEYGGRIRDYEFTLVDFYTTTIKNAYLNYIYPEAGNYEIQLRVMDNDGIWSEKVSYVVEVN